MMLHKCAREEKYVKWMWFDNFDKFNMEKSGLVDRSSARAEKNIWFYNANIKFSRNFNGLPFFELVFQIVQS